MQSLRRLAIAKLPLTEIWNQGLLGQDSPLPNETKQELATRLTLDNLYRDGLLDENLDLDLFAYILQKENLGPLLYPYLVDQDVAYTDEYTFYYVDDEEQEPRDIFDADVVTYYLPEKEITISIQDKLQSALKQLLHDLISFLENPGLPIANVYTLPVRDYSIPVDDDYAYNEETVDHTFIWQQYNNAYRLFVIEDNKVVFLTTLPSIDQVMRDVLLYQNVFITRLFKETSTPDTLSPEIRCALQCLKTSSTIDLWRSLANSGISVGQPLQMAPQSMVTAEKILTIGDYLYIISPEMLRFYVINDALVLLNVLNFNQEKWKLEPLDVLGPSQD